MKISGGCSPLNSYATLHGEKKDVAAPLPELKKNDVKNTHKAAVSDIDSAVSQITDKIKYLEKMQERLRDKLQRIYSDSPTSSIGSSCMASAQSFSIRVNKMVLEYRRNAVMAQANALPQRVLSLINR